MARLLKYLQFRDYKSKLLKTIEDEDAASETGMRPAAHMGIQKSKSKIKSAGLVVFAYGCRWRWCEPAQAAIGSGFPGVDGSDGRPAVAGRAPGSRPHQTGADGGQRSPRCLHSDLIWIWSCASIFNVNLPFCLWIFSVWSVRLGTWTRLSTPSSVRAGSLALVRFSPTFEIFL